jgi:general secretion pathway protein A
MGGITVYLNYWRLKKPPFDDVPDPDMYFDMHQSLDEAESTLLCAIEEADECLCVVTGNLGVGKTLCLRVVLNSLDPANYQTAFIANPDMPFPKLLREIISQLDGKPCYEKWDNRLLDQFNKRLFQLCDQGKKAVIFVDEERRPMSHLLLQGLCRLTHRKDDTRSLFTVVLAGRSDLMERLEKASSKSLRRRIGALCRIDGIDSRATMKDYVEYRLERAGLSGDSMFTEAAYDVLWKLSGKGIPRLINRLCSLSLKAAGRRQLTQIDAEIVGSRGERFIGAYRRLYKTAPYVMVSEAAGVVLEPAPAASAVLPSAAMLKNLSPDEREKIASQLATEKMKELSSVLDPFEAWNQVRQEILKQLNTAQNLIPTLKHAV